MNKVQARHTNLGTISREMKHKAMSLSEINKGVYVAKSVVRKVSLGALCHLEIGEMRKNKPGRQREQQRQERVVSWKLSEEKTSRKRE